MRSFIVGKDDLAIGGSVLLVDEAFRCAEPFLRPVESSRPVHIVTPSFVILAT
jgi:hypothetical protein